MHSSLFPLIDELDTIIAEMAEFHRRYQPELAQIHPQNRLCASNLVDYIAFRCQDRSPLQNELARVGLSSLGRSEAAIRPQLQRIRSLLEQLLGNSNNFAQLLDEDPMLQGRENLEANSDDLFGARPENRHTRIMVTMPAEAATDDSMIEQFLSSGMNLARINCAHDSPAVWKRIAQRVRALSDSLDIPCRIMMDLAGPKLRTGEMPQGPRVIKGKIPKDNRGHTLEPGKVVFYCTEQPPKLPEKATLVPLTCRWTPQMEQVLELQLSDTRGKRRRLRVTEARDGILYAQLPAGTYFETGQTIILHLPKSQIMASVGELPAKENFLALQVGDQLKLIAEEQIASHAKLDADGTILIPATVSCGVPEALAAPEIGHRIKMDDGKFTGEVIAKEEGSLLLRITEAPEGGGKLKTEKGINFPDSELPISGLTSKDIEDLETVCEVADLIALSFVNTSEDVETLQKELKDRDCEHIGVILKIETKRAFENLPDLLLTAMRSQRVGVMVARGDLGVEIGWRQMAEKQEEILWLCAAAHIPAIWATQVLESLAKEGQPTRSEITDAAMAQRAECVMLNKGPYIHRAVRMLHRIIKTMDSHQYKKTARLPKFGCVYRSE